MPQGEELTAEEFNGGKSYSIPFLLLKENMPPTTPKNRLMKQLNKCVCFLKSAINAGGVRGPPAFWTQVQQIWGGGGEGLVTFLYLFFLFFFLGGGCVFEMNLYYKLLYKWGLLLIINFFVFMIGEIITN